jgi:hypothetical protein
MDLLFLCHYCFAKWNSQTSFEVGVLLFVLSCPVHSLSGAVSQYLEIYWNHGTLRWRLVQEFGGTEWLHSTFKMFG